MRLPTVLVVQHTADETAAELGEWLAADGVLLEVSTPYAGGELPDSLDGYAGLVVLGGPMSAMDDHTSAWLPATRALLRAGAGSGLPTLGICLGAQLLAVALGGRVDPGESGPEVGPGLVAKRDAAAHDPLFGPVPFTPDVLHWHFDQISVLPAGSTLLASSTRYPHQAFRVGPRAWGLQFHIETRPEMVRRWAANDAAGLAALGVDVAAVLAGHELDQVHADLAEVWRPAAARFAELVRQVEYAGRG